MRILLVEDDPVLAHGIALALKSSSVVDHGSRVSFAIDALKQVQYDCVVLDLGLRDGDGLEVLKWLRSHRSAVPVLVVTARDTLADRIRGLDNGADDYLVKPFELAELEARIRALLRRRYMQLRNEISLGSLRFDSSGRRAFLDDKPLELSRRELGVLETLMLNVGRVVSKAQLLDSISSWEEELGLNAIEVYIHRIRKKIAPSGFSIRTFRSLGYMLENVSKAAA
jgi:two-component system OmpR family response regulator